MEIRNFSEQRLQNLREALIEFDFIGNINNSSINKTMCILKTLLQSRLIVAYIIKEIF